MIENQQAVLWRSNDLRRRITAHRLGNAHAVKPSQDGPRNAAFPDLDTHEKPIIVESLAIDHLTAHGSLPTRRSNLCVLTKLPGAGCAHAGAVRTEIVSVRSFVPFA